MSQPNKIGVHLLTAYPPSNPNRDELGQPKTAVVGGVTRQRVSSQCIKRTWRTSDVMQALDAPFSVRTRDLGPHLKAILLEANVAEKAAQEIALAIANQFGKADKKTASHSEMVTIGREEWDAAERLAKLVAVEKREPTEAELSALPQETISLDCALFGRMRAANAALNVDAAVSVSHPLTVNRVEIEADFWTSVDDLSGDDAADRGAGGMGEVEYGSGVYYTYFEISVPALLKNVGNATALTRQAVEGLIKAAATTTPGGHRTTFGNPVRASYIRVELGEASGNLFMAAYEKPSKDTASAIVALREAADGIGQAYGLNRELVELSVPEKKSTLAEVVAAAGRFTDTVVASIKP